MISTARGLRFRLQSVSLGIVFFAICNFTFAQNNPFSSDDFNQLWTNYALSVRSKSQPKLSYGADVGIRTELSNQDWRQFLIRPTISWQFSPIVSGAFAVAYFDTNNNFESNVSEFRMHQDINLRWPDFNFFRMFFRVRVEQRWFYYDLLDDRFNWRFRFLVGAQSKDFKLGQGLRPFYFKAMYESFRVLQKNDEVEVFVNNSRAYFAYGHRISSSFRYEIHYIYQQSGLLVSDGFQAGQNIFRLRLFHRINNDPN